LADATRCETEFNLSLVATEILLLLNLDFEVAVDFMEEKDVLVAVFWIRWTILGGFDLGFWFLTMTVDDCWFLFGRS